MPNTNTKSFNDYTINSRYKVSTIGFGVPATASCPHHFQVNIPKKNGNIEISEHLGIEKSKEKITEIQRCSIKRTSWTIIRREVQSSFNDRLRKKKIKTSSWSNGNNQVDRLLGRELCVLAWAIERLSKDNVRLALKNWLGLRPEDRWWLFSMAARSTDIDIKRGYGWRIALGYALATSDISYVPSETRSVNFSQQSQISLQFEKT